ncbi:MAG TPA: hypothetical protein VMT31_06360 [Methanomicrobiales archaeon]|jgi:hypothetical protein|nr:hypothetical protein [Methanomicrobiales archaeon]
MRCPVPVLVLLLLLAALVLPVSAADTNRIGYLSLDGVSIELQGPDARIEVDYALDPGMDMIILLFGKSDLQRKLEKALNFPSLRAGEVGLTHAVFTEIHAAENYGERAFWFPPHRFGITFPRVRVEAPGYSLSFTDARSIPRGFGYFGADS